MPGYESIGSSKRELLTGSAYVYRKWCGVRRSTWLLVIYCATYLSYLLLGGCAMAVIEEGEQVRLKQEAADLKETFMQKYDVNRTELEALLELAIHYNNFGISALDKHKGIDNWSFGQGILFTVSTVTTIGYGHVYPLTSEGKLFSVVYAILGIPFTLVFLSASVQRLLEPTCHALAFLFARLSPRLSPFAIRVIHLVFMSAVFIVCFIAVPSALFCALEPEWSLLDGFYFVFISLTTIGFGDYIPGDHESHRAFRDVYKTAVAAYLLLGLVFMTLTATVFYDIPQLNLASVLHQQKDIHLATDDEGRSGLGSSDDGPDGRKRRGWKEAVKILLKKKKKVAPAEGD